VFRLGERGLELIEIAPGIDLRRDILDRMAFAPVMDAPPAIMDARIFRDEPMGLRDEMLKLPLAERFVYDAQRTTLFINLEGHTVASVDDVEAIRAEVERALAGVHERVDAIVNYDGFTILPDVLDAYSEMVQQLMRERYADVSRYTGSSFLRMKLGEALKQRGLAPHIFENAAQAREELDQQRATR
jgi:propionate CoA-transferase